MNHEAPRLDPWKLVWGQPYIDCRTLALAIEQDLKHNREPDFRTRLLVRDATSGDSMLLGCQEIIAVAVRQSRRSTNGRAFLDDPKLKPQIEENWRFIFQEPLVAERPPV